VGRGQAARSIAWTDRATVHKELAMGIGISILLLVIGLVLVLDAVALPAAVSEVVATGTVGWICVVVGILGLVIAVATMRRGRDTTVVEERRY
jgi:hypothetical protein